MIRFGSTVALAGVALAMALSGCGDSGTTNVGATVTWYPSTPQPTVGPAVSGSPSAATTSVAALPAVGEGQSNGLGTPVKNVAANDQLAFDPTSTTVKVGDVVEWKNTGSTAHNVTFDGQETITSGTLQLNDTWQVKFTNAGTYNYHCTFHANMNGTVTVTG